MNDSMQALGWTLVHFCWQAAAIALLYRILDLAFSRSRSSVRYALALAAMMSMFVVSVLTFGYEEMRLTRNSASPLMAQHLVVSTSLDTFAPSATAQTPAVVQTDLW